MMKKLAKLTALLAAAALLLGAVGCSDDDGNSFLSKQKTVDVKTKDGSVTSVSSDVVFDPAGIAKATVYGTKIIVTPLRAGTTVMTIKVSGEEYKDKEVKILITVAEDGTIEYEDDDGTGGNTGSGGGGNNSGSGNNGGDGNGGSSNNGGENQGGGNTGSSGDGNNSSGGGTGSDSSNPGTGGTTGGTTGGSGNGSENQGGGEEDDGGNPGPVNPGPVSPGTPGTGNEGENKGGEEGDGDYDIPSKPGTGGNDIDSGKTPGNGDKDENKGNEGDDFGNTGGTGGNDIVKATAKTYDFTKWSEADLAKFGGEFYTDSKGVAKNQLKSPEGTTELSTGATIYNSGEDMIMIRTQSTTDKTPIALNYNGGQEDDDLSRGVDVSKLDRYVSIPVDGMGIIIASVRFAPSSSGTGNLQAAFVDVDGNLLGKVVEMDVNTGGEATIEGIAVPRPVILAFSRNGSGGGGLDVYSISVAP